MNRNAYKAKSPSVAKDLTEWKRMVKWEEDSIASPVCDVRVEEDGFFVQFITQDMEGNVIEIAQIVDIRCGKAPKDMRLVENFRNTGETSDPVEERCFQIITSESFTQQTFYNFLAFTAKDCKKFVDGLLSLCHHFINNNLCQMDYVRKMHKRILLSCKDDKYVAAKDIIKSVAKDDKKKVMEALKLAGLKPTDKKGQNLPKDKFTFEAFYKFYSEMLGGRPELDKIFNDIKGNRRNYLTTDQTVEFLNRCQRDPRLNEILFPYHNTDGTKKLIQLYERDKSKQKVGQITLEGFTNYLMSPDNLPTNILNLPVYQNMDQPLSHYFINSSHNTYLTGPQISGRSSVEIYRQVLLSGCRCIELDCWDGEDNEPTITHGFTFCSSILFKDVIEAVNEAAFKVSPYPVILSFENHCTPRQQQKMADYCIQIFKEKLLAVPLDDPKAQLKPGCMLPSPEMLKYKILVKNKKRKEDMPDQEKNEEEVEGGGSTAPGGERADTPPNGEENDKQWEEREEEAERLLSQLVNYITPAPKFRGFEAAAQKNVSYEMSSFMETAALNFLKEDPTAFVDYNKRQISRIYPKGARMKSDNLQPQMFWNIGCQMVALNFQTLDPPMQINLGKFEFNNRSGYVLKPEFMTKKRAVFNPFLETTVEGVVAAELSVKIISGQFLSDKKCGVRVELEIYGIANDSVRRKHQTRTVMNSTNPTWNDEPFRFSKISIPDLAMMRFIVNDDAGKMIGQRIIPLESVQTGYRYISVRNEFNQAIGMASIFVFIEIKDYIPSEMADFAKALVDPIAHLSKDDLMSMRQDMLKTLVDDDDLVDDKPPVPSQPAGQAAGQPPVKTRPKRRVKGRPVEGDAPAPAAPAAPKHALIEIKGLESFQNIQPAAGAVPGKAPKQEFAAGGLYLGDDSAKLVKDESAGKPKEKAPVLPWDMPVEDVPNDDERMLPRLKGVDFSEITEETLKKSKAWLKYYNEAEKKKAKQLKMFEKESEMLAKSQKIQMDKLLKENASTRANQIKKQSKKSGDASMDDFIKNLDEKQEKEVENMKKQHLNESLRVEKIHKTEKLEAERAELKANHQQFKKIKSQAQEEQLAKFELYQKNELLDEVKLIQARQIEKLKTLQFEIKDSKEMSQKKKELDEKVDREVLGKKKSMANIQEIRREQLVEEHKEQLKLADQVYLKRLKELDQTGQSEIEKLEAQIQEIGFIDMN